MPLNARLPTPFVEPATMTTYTLTHTLTLATPLPAAALPAPTPLPGLTLRDRARLLARTTGEGETTVWLLLAAAALLVLVAGGALAALAVSPQALLGSQGLANAGSARVLQAFVALVLWLGLMGLGAAAWSTGSFDRMLRSRAAQAACVGAVVTAAVWLGAQLALPVTLAF